MKRNSRKMIKEEAPPPPPIEEEEEEVISQPEEEYDDDEGVTYEDEDDDATDEEGLEADWEAGEVPEEMEAKDDEDDTGSMSPTDAMLDTMSEEVGGPSGKMLMGTGSDPICYHCGVPLIEPPLRLPAEDASIISIPLHCEVCVRGIHSQCHLALGGSLPTQEESFVCFHCRTSQHGKYEMKAAERVKIPVGPAHQAPLIPPMFFDTPTEAPLSVSRDRFVQLWSADAAKVVIPNPQKISEYIQKAAQIWPDKLRVNSTGGSLASGSVRRVYLGRAAGGNGASSVLNHYWAPFSPDFAMTVLHRSNYNIEKALHAIKNPLLRDCFSTVCYPPTKPYYNKWKPKDRRWRMMKIPFPPSRSEAPDVTNIYAVNYEGDGPRLRSRRGYFNYSY
jgi:hypothetical protein